MNSSVLGDDVAGVDEAGDVAEEGEEDVDRQVAAAPLLDEHTHRLHPTYPSSFRQGTTS